MAPPPKRQELFSEWIRDRKVLVSSPPPYVALGAEDLQAAAREAALGAADGRTRPYAARRALSSMALLFMAFESWLNHRLTERYHFTRDRPVPDGEKLLKLLLRGDLSTKARHLPKYYGGSVLPIERHPDLAVLTTIRHELIHGLPATNVVGEINRLEVLEGKGMLLSSGSLDGEYMLHERLQSYDLAWWAWSAVDSIVQAIAAASPDAAFGLDLHNFDLPHQWQIRSPQAIEAASPPHG